MSEPLLVASAEEQLRALASGAVGARELVAAALARLDAVDGVLRIAVARRDEAALDEARAVDEARAAGRPVGPLAGLPVTVKDSFAVAGVPRTVGVRDRDAPPEPKDAEAVRRLRAAGVVVLATSNVPALLLSGDTVNDVVGRTATPYDAGRCALGSSGGAAAAVAAGIAAVDLGTDSGGSTRGPAAACGVVGVKPAQGRVPRTGHAFIDRVPPLDRVTEAGPIARTVADAVLVLRVVEGPDAGDPDARILPTTPASTASRSVAGARVAVLTSAGRTASDPATAAAVAAAADALVDAGAVPEAAELPGRTDAEGLWVRWVRADGGAALRAEAVRLGWAPGLPLPGPVAWMDREALSTAALRELLGDVRGFRVAAQRWASAFDLVVAPVLPGPAPRVGERVDYSGLYGLNLLGWPAVSVRAGSVDGVPLGVQIAAPRGDDALALAAAAAVEARTDGYRPPDLTALGRTASGTDSAWRGEAR